MIFQKDSMQLMSLFYNDIEVFKSVYFFDDYSLKDVRTLFYYWPKPRAFFMAKILCVFNFITKGNIYYNVIYLSIINLACISYFLITVKKYISKYYYSFLFVLCMIPTIAFNTSSLEKEIVTMSAIFLLFSVGIRWYNKEGDFLNFILFLLAGFFLYKIKYYYIVPILVFSFPIYINKFVNKRIYKIILVIFSSLIFILFANVIHPYLSIELAFKSIIQANHSLQLRSLNGMAIPFHFEEYTILEFIINLPLAFFHGCFGPFIWQFKNIPMLYVGMENLVLLVLSLISFIGVLREKKISLVVFMSLLYVAFLATVLALYSPNYGTLMRYKVVFTPFLWVLVLNNLPFTSDLKNKLKNFSDV